MASPDILTINRGSIVAPAGCGKTESIVQAVTRNDGKPALVLTHTNAGVCALRSRMVRARVAATKARVTTLDGWCLQVVSSYPELAGLRPDLSAIHYPMLRAAATRAVSSGGLDAILRASYSRVIVDEYQDCTQGQHQLVVALADTAEADAMAALRSMAAPTSLVVGSSTNPASRVAFAKAHDGVQVVERADMPEVRDAADQIGGQQDLERLKKVLKFASSVMSGIDQAFVDRLNQLVAGTAAPADDAERAFLVARHSATFGNLARMLEFWSMVPGRRVFRPDLLAVMMDGMRRTSEDEDLKASVLDVREAKRSTGREVPPMAIGSTLLLKGLEAERVLILDASTMDACNTYVALSRASKSVTVISDKPVIGRMA